MKAVTTTELQGLSCLARGKVRDIYEVDADHILLVATDRISAFDVVLPDPIPGKGIVLTQIAVFWFEHFQNAIRHHLVAVDPKEMPAAVRKHADLLRGRSMLVRKTKVHPVECIVRGFLLGSGWKDYQRSGSLCGISLPAGLEKNHRFDPPLFTPSTKAEEGHDENISFETMVQTIGSEAAETLRSGSLDVFDRGRSFAEERGIIICDTKFEWGAVGSETLLIDEVLTPDSSRFWRREDAERALAAGRDPESYDKQLVRDWLETQDWDKTAPGPRIDPEVIATSRQRYLEIYERLAGHPVPEIEE